MEEGKIIINNHGPENIFGAKNQTSVGVNNDKKSISDVLAEKAKKKGPVLPKRIINTDDKKLYGPALERPSVIKKPTTPPK